MLPVTCALGPPVAAYSGHYADKRADVFPTSAREHQSSSSHLVVCSEWPFYLVQATAAGGRPISTLVFILSPPHPANLEFRPWSASRSEFPDGLPNLGRAGRGMEGAAERNGHRVAHAARPC